MPLQLIPYPTVCTVAEVTVTVPDAANVPDQPSLPSPPVAVQLPDELHVNVIGVLTGAEIALAEIVVGGGAETAICVDA